MTTASSLRRACEIKKVVVCSDNSLGVTGDHHRINVAFVVFDPCCARDDSRLGRCRYLGNRDMDGRELRVHQRIDKGLLLPVEARGLGGTAVEDVFLLVGAIVASRGAAASEGAVATGGVVVSEDIAAADAEWRRGWGRHIRMLVVELNQGACGGPAA